MARPEMQGSPPAASLCTACASRTYTPATYRQVTCPLCAMSLTPDGTDATRPAPVGIPPRYDLAAFQHAAVAALAASGAVNGEVVASFAVPADLQPLYLPFRRVRVAHQAHHLPEPGSQTGGLECAVVHHEPVEYVVDVCLAAGLDEDSLDALQSIVAGHAPEAVSAEQLPELVLAGETGEEVFTRRTGRAVRRLIAARAAAATQGSANGQTPGHEAAVVGAEDFLLPVWAHSVVGRGQCVRVLMDAGSGSVIGPTVSGASSEASPARLDALGHWAWLPALFCALLVVLVHPSVVRWPLAVLGVLTLLGGHFAVRYLRTELGRVRAQVLVAQRAPRTGGSLLQLDAVRRRLGFLHRARSGLPAAYAGVAVGAHLYVTAFLLGNPAGVYGLRAEVPGLQPWAPVDANLLVSPLAISAGRHERLATSFALDPAPATTARRAGHGRPLLVGPGGFPDLAAAVAAAASGDRIRISAGRYVGPRLLLDKDLTIEGLGAVTYTWHGGRGPFVRVAGRGTRVTLEHLALEGFGINTAIIGDPNVAYGEPPTGAGQQVRLRDVVIDSPDASAIYSTSPGARYLIEGGRYRGAGAAIVMVDGGELSIRPYRSAPARISSDGSSGVANNAVGLSIQHTRRLTIDNVAWSGNPGGDVAIQGDLVAAVVTGAANAAATQRVLLVDERGAALREVEFGASGQPLRFRVEHGLLEPLAAIVQPMAGLR